MVAHDPAAPPPLTEPETPPTPPPGPRRAIRLERVPWDTAMLEDMRRIPLDSPIDGMPDVIARVNRGTAHALSVTVEGRYAGLVVYAIEANGGARELEIICARFKAAAPISAHVMQLLIEKAAGAGCQSVRFTTVHEPLARWMVSRHGFRLSEVTLRKAL
jgi:hypothetical protein